MKSIPLTIAMAVIAACGGAGSGPTSLDPGAINEEPPVHELTSTDIMAREPIASKALCQHILISYDKVADETSSDAARARTGEQAVQLVEDLYKRAVAGEPFEELMKEYSDDPGSATNGRAYEVEPGGKLILEFRRMGVRLKVGEIGKIHSDFGWHIMKRTE